MRVHAYAVPASSLLRLFALFGCLAAAPALPAQAPVTLSGVVRDAESGETLIGAAITAPALKRGAYTNAYGFYSLSLPASADSVEVRFVYSGYETQVRRILPSAAQKLDIEMAVASLEEVVIAADSYREQLASTQMSVDRLSMQEAKVLPALFGEVDIIKTLQLKPGVSSGSEGSSGIFVRGGGPDQNLVLLDNTVVYNPSHLFGFFSTFNSDAVKDVQLYKGGFPGRYGGRLSSVIDVKMNEGNRKQYAVTGGLGLISSRLTVEGPIAKDKSSFILSGRRTYVDIFTRLLNEVNVDNEDWNPIPDYFFYDLNGKVNYEISPKDQIFLSGYLGRDKFGFEDGTFNFKFSWGNSNAALRWNHFFSPKLFVNTTASYSDYNYVIANRFDRFSFNLGSQITDGAVRTDFTWLPSERHSVHFGADGIYHRFIVGRVEANSTDTLLDIEGGDTYFGTELGAYFEDEWKISERVSLHSGLRVSGFASDSTFYTNLEPRAALLVRATENISVKASYARMAQYLHLVANSGASLPTDVWYPSTRLVKPQLSDQVAAGITIAIGDKFLVSNEVYYKWLHNQIDFRDGANLFVNSDLESEFVFGRGWTYGNEFYLEKKNGKLTGWIGYTLSWAWRQFDGTWRAGDAQFGDAINNGAPFHPRNDKRHDITVVGIYQLSRRWSLSASWEYRTGNAITLPQGRFFSFGPDLGGGGQITPIPDYPERNSFRMPAYHRLDVGVVMKMFPKWGKSDLTFSAYNAYNRRNPYFIFFETQYENGIPVGNQAKQIALFPIIPSITYNFSF